MWRRPLAETLIDVLAAVELAHTAGFQVRAREVELTLPLEVSLVQVAGEATFLANLPLWRWRTDFDQQPSRIHVTFEECQL